MGRIRLVKGKTSITRRNVFGVINPILIYINLVGLILIALKMFDVL